jgi:hypothetical protein
MEKFTKYESAIIIASLNSGMSNDLAGIEKAEEAGKTPLFTAEYVQQTYEHLIERIQKMSRKNN